MTPDVVQFDKNKMTKPVFNLILGCKTMKELGIVLDFSTKEIMIDHAILPMRDINSLTSPSMDKAWAVNNSISHEPHSKQEATEQVIHILDANYEKEDLQSVVRTTVVTLVSKTKISYWSYSQSLRNFLTEH